VLTIITTKKTELKHKEYMKNSQNKIFVIITLIFFMNFGYSQTDEIKIKFIGNCGMYLTDGNINLYVDFPYKSGAHKYMKYDENQLYNISENSIFLFTHKHKDHYSKKLVRKMKKKYNGKIYDNWNVNKLDDLNNTLNNFSIKAIKTPHSFTFKHYSYLITWHNKKIYFTGDTGSLEAINGVKNIDWLFTNPWLFMNAKSKKIKIDTKMIGLYHLYPNQKIEGEIPKNMMILKKENEIITIANNQ